MDLKQKKYTVLSLNSNNISKDFELLTTKTHHQLLLGLLERRLTLAEIRLHRRQIFLRVVQIFLAFVQIFATLVQIFLRVAALVVDANACALGSGGVLGGATLGGLERRGQTLNLTLCGE